MHPSKGGRCPPEDSGYWEGRAGAGGRGPGAVVLHVPGGPGDCSEDWQCPGEEKCCHARVARDRLVMTCRSHPSPSTLLLRCIFRLPEELYRPLYHSWRTANLELTEERRLEGDLEPGGLGGLEVQRVRGDRALEGDQGDRVLTGGQGDRALAGDLTLPEPWSTRDDLYLRRLKGDYLEEGGTRFKT